MAKTSKYSKRDLAILRQLDRYKWGREYTCRRCGHNEYLEGKQPFSRRCKRKECSYDESLLKNTALEGLRFPVEKAYLILCDIVKFCNPDYDAQNIWSGDVRRKIDRELGIKYRNDKDYESDLISYNEIYKRTEEWVISGADQKKLSMRWYRGRKITFASLARKYELEENTIAKFFDKLNGRIPIEEYDLSWPPFNRVLQFIDGFTLVKLLGFVMFPLGAGWKWGEKKIKDKWYVIDVPRMSSDNPGWRIKVNTFFRKNEKGDYVEYYNKPDEPEYLCEPDREEHNKILRF